MRLNSEDQEAIIHPGDILIGDINGVVCLPQGLAEQAIELIQSQVEADKKVEEDLRNGKTAQEAMKHRENVKQPKL